MLHIIALTTVPKHPQRTVFIIIIIIIIIIIYIIIYLFSATSWRVAVKALRYKLDGRRFESRWGEWLSWICLILLAALGPGLYSASNRNEYQKQKINVFMV
jgi:hypothetical protein